MSSSAMKSWNMIGFIRLQTPPGLRKSGMPDSVDMPAPVKITPRRDSPSRRLSSPTPSMRLFLLRLGPIDRLGDQPARLRGIAPAVQLHPLAGLKILIVLEEV